MRASLNPVDSGRAGGGGATGTPKTLPRVPCVHPPGLARWMLATRFFFTGSWVAGEPG